jgi:hypothetical protein
MSDRRSDGLGGDFCPMRIVNLHRGVPAVANSDAGASSGPVHRLRRQPLGQKAIAEADDFLIALAAGPVDSYIVGDLAAQETVGEDGVVSTFVRPLDFVVRTVCPRPRRSCAAL